MGRKGKYRGGSDYTSIQVTKESRDILKQLRKQNESYEKMLKRKGIL